MLYIGYSVICMVLVGFLIIIVSSIVGYVKEKRRNKIMRKNGYEYKTTGEYGFYINKKYRIIPAEEVMRNSIDDLCKKFNLKR